MKIYLNFVTSMRIFVTFKNVRNGKKCRLKYIIRAEKFEDVFAIKFYASRDRKSPHDKYSLAHGDMSVQGILSIFQKCTSVMQEIMLKHPGASFVIKGAESYNPRTMQEESEHENQRFRIYRNYLLKNIGEETFYHIQHPSISVYQLTYKDNEDCKEKSFRHIKMLVNKFGLDL